MDTDGGAGVETGGELGQKPDPSYANCPVTPDEKQEDAASKTSLEPDEKGDSHYVDLCDMETDQKEDVDNNSNNDKEKIAETKLDEGAYDNAPVIKQEDDYAEIGPSIAPVEESSSTRLPGNDYVDEFSRQPSQPSKEKFSMSLPPKPSLYKSMSSQSEVKGACSNRRLVFLGGLIALVIIAVLLGVIVFLAVRPPSSESTETFVATVTLDREDYNPDTYGNPNSKEYREMKTVFCENVTHVLSDGKLGQDLKECSVTGFSKGSLVVHFQLVVVVSGESTKESLQQRLQQEFSKENGLFRGYIKDPTTAKLTMETASEHTATSSTETPVHPTTTSHGNRPTTDSLTTMTTDTMTTLAACPSNCERCESAEVGKCDVDGCSTGYRLSPDTQLCDACPMHCDYCGFDEVGTCDTDGCASGYEYNTGTKLCHACPTHCDHCGNAEVGKCDSDGCASGYQYNTGTKLCQRRPYCDTHTNPCEHGGTCISKGPDNYVCMCPKCGCSSEPPLPDCAIDKANICGENKFSRGENLLDHPYNCTQFIFCNKDHTYSHEDYVDQYEDGKHVFYRAKQSSGWKHDENLKCAVQEPRVPCADVSCLNGGTCEDTLSGFKCHCASGYKRRKCEIRLIPCAELPCDSGTCYPDMDSGSHCVCDTGYRGHLCDIPIKYCADITCFNGGTCYERPENDAICVCLRDYTGSDCGTKIVDHCERHSCNLNYTVCKNNPAKSRGYECVCKSCSCNTVVSFDESCIVDPTQACIDARSTPRYSGRDSFFISHPYNCDWYIWCYSNGYIGANMKCAPPNRFNPNYTSENVDYCLDPQWLDCVETCPGEVDDQCPSNRK